MSRDSQSCVDEKHTRNLWSNYQSIYLITYTYLGFILSISTIDQIAFQSCSKLISNMIFLPSNKRKLPRLGKDGHYSCPCLEEQATTINFVDQFTQVAKVSYIDTLELQHPVKSTPTSKFSNIGRYMKWTMVSNLFGNNTLPTILYFQTLMYQYISSIAACDGGTDMISLYNHIHFTRHLSNPFLVSP